MCRISKNKTRLKIYKTNDITYEKLPSYWSRVLSLGKSGNGNAAKPKALEGKVGEVTLYFHHSVIQQLLHVMQDEQLFGKPTALVPFCESQKT
jgi:hypothetical protein